MAAKVIIIQGQDLQNFYEDRLDYLLSKYHNYLPDPYAASITREQMAEASAVLAAHDCKIPEGNTTPIGKLVL